MGEHERGAQSLTPRPKLVAGTLASALTVLLTSVLDRALDVDLTPVEAGALTTVVGAIVAYLVPDRADYTDGPG